MRNSMVRADSGPFRPWRKPPEFKPMKPTQNPFLTLSAAFVLTTGARAAVSQTYEDGNSLNTWNVSDTNWDTSVVWVNDNDALFAGTGEAITVGTVGVHNIAINSANYSFTGGTITLTGTTPTITNSADSTIGSVLAGSQGLVKAGSGKLTLSGANTYTGVATVNGGMLEIVRTATVATNSTVTQSATSYSVANGSTLRFDASNISSGAGGFIWDINPVSVNAGGTLELYATTHSDIGTAVLLYWGNSDQISGAGTIKKDGAGVFDINGNGTLNNFTGLINVSQGTLALQGGPTSTVGNFAINIASGATLDIRTDSHKVGALNGAGSIIKSFNGFGGTLTIGNDNANGDFGGTFTDQPTAIPVTKAGTGTQIFSGAVSYRGATTINAGKLVIDGTSTNSAFAVNTGGTLGGAGTINGTVTLNSGGILAPGSGTGSSIAKLTVNNTLTLKTGGTTKCEINRTGGVLTNDQLYVNSVVFAGTLEVTASGDALVVGDEFKLFDSGTYSGSFTTVTLPVLSGGLVWDQSALSSTGTIKVSNLADTPVFSLADGTYLAPQSLGMSSMSGSTIYYTFASGGTIPADPTIASASGTAGSGTATLNLPSTTTWTVKAMATKPGMGNSAVAMGTFTLIPSPVWTNTAGGYWSDLPEDATNWLSSVVAGGHVPADFSTLALPADTTVTLDGDRTIGSLLFGDTGNQFDWTLDGASTLTLIGTTPTIAVNNQTATVIAPLGGTNGLAKTGAGELVLAGGGALSGGTSVNAGTLTFKMPSNSNWTVNGGNKTIASGTTMKVDMSPQVTQYLTTSIGATVINSGATLELYGTDTNASTFYVLEANSWTPSGSGTVKVTGGASIAVKSTDFSNFTGAIEVENGQFANNSPNTSAGNVFNVNVASGSKFDMRADGITFNALNGAGSVMKSYSGFPGALTIGNGNGSGDFSGPMTSQPISYTVVKTGTGTQVLSGALSYGGTTTVNGGKLVINGASTGSAFTVATGGTLGGTGSIGGSVTVNSGGTLAPGESVGTLTLGTAATLDNGSTYAVDITGAATHDKIVSSGTIAANGTIKVSFGGGYVPVAGASFDIADGTITGTPVFDFTAATLPDGLTWDTTQFATTGVVKVSGGGYDSWISGYFNGVTDPAIIGADADPDHDGVANGIEFLTGTVPNSGSSHTLPSIVRNGSGDLVVSFQRDDQAESCAVVVEWSTTLQSGSWTQIAVPNDAVSSATLTVVDNGAAPDAVTVVIPATADPRKFARVRIDIPVTP